MKESHEFVVEHAGSLPEAVAEGDLDTLNSGLRFLFADLRSAQRLYREEGDDQARSRALGSLADFVQAISPAALEEKPVNHPI